MDLMTEYRLDLQPMDINADRYPTRRRFAIQEAVYAARSGIRDHPDICALPYPLTERQLQAEYRIPVPGYDHEAVRNLPPYARKEHILLLQKAYAALPVVSYMDKAVADALFSSYLGRETRIGAPLEILGKPQAVTARNGEGGRPLSFVIFGPSGCGKTQAMNFIRRRYPQAIHHNLGTVEYLQIPIICITAQMSNMSEIQIAIARAVDDIVGEGPVWERQISKHNISRTSAVIKTIIRVYHVGCIIIDEAQYLNFGSTAASVENLVSISEQEGCALGFIGNRDMLSRMDKHSRFVSRVMSSRVDAGFSEPVEREFFRILAAHLWQFQWTDEITPESEEILDVLCRDSMYNVAFLKAILMRVQAEAMMDRHVTQITPEYIHGIVEKRFAEISTLLFAGTDGHEREILLKLEQKNNEILSDAKQLKLKAGQEILREQELRDELWGDGKYSKIETILESYHGITKSQTARVLNQMVAKNPDLTCMDVKFVVDAVKSYMEKQGRHIGMSKGNAKKKPLDAAAETVIRETVAAQLTVGSQGGAS